MSNKVVHALNQQVANYAVLYVKFHHFHWFVKGHHFFTLHAVFEELYNEADKCIDELAERILALEAQPVSTMKEFLELSSLKEAEGLEKEDKMIRCILSDFELISNELQDGIHLAESEGDSGSADLLIGMKQSLAKHIWMFKSFLE